MSRAEGRRGNIHEVTPAFEGHITFAPCWEKRLLVGVAFLTSACQVHPGWAKRPAGREECHPYQQSLLSAPI